MPWWTPDGEDSRDAFDANDDLIDRARFAIWLGIVARIRDIPDAGDRLAEARRAVREHWGVWP